MLEAVLVLAAAVADAFGPRWALLTEIALLRHQARRPSTLGCQAARGAIRPNRPGRTRRCHPDVEERPAHRPTRDPSSLAPRRLQGSWRWRSRTQPASRLATEAAALVRSMASANTLWGRR